MPAKPGQISGRNDTVSGNALPGTDQKAVRMSAFGAQRRLAVISPIPFKAMIYKPRGASPTTTNSGQFKPILGGLMTGADKSGDSPSRLVFNWYERESQPRLPAAFASSSR